MKTEGAEFTVDDCVIQVEYPVLVTIAALRKSPTPPLVEACLQCGTVCFPTIRCSCCDVSGAELFFNQGARGRRPLDAGIHRTLLGAELDAKIREMMAA